MSFEDEIEDLHKEVDELKETIEQVKRGEYAPPAYAPPKYPKGLYPLPKLRALIEKLAKQYGVEVKGTLADLLGKLTGRTQAKTKEECEEKGGKWDPEKKSCKLPELKESLEVFREIEPIGHGFSGAVLPSENQSLRNLSDQGADLLAIEKFGKERGWKPFEGEEEE